MRLLCAIRYCLVIAVVPPLFLAGFVVCVAAAAVRLSGNPASAVEALTPVLLLQLFAASSGFHLPARRGHFDLLLTSGTPRWHIALAHCLVSIAPGLISWLCVGLLELSASHGAYAVSYEVGTCVAFVSASLVAWGSAVYTSRVAAAMGWLLVMTIPPLARLVSPLRLLGVGLDNAHAQALAIALASTAVPVLTAVWCIVRGAAPLEAAQ